MDRIRCDCAVGFIFDINEYGGSLQDDLENVPGNPFGHINVGSGWTSGGIRKGSSSAKNMRLNSHRFPIKDCWGHKASIAKVADINDTRKAYGLNFINFSSGSSGILLLSSCAKTEAIGLWSKHLFCSFPSTSSATSCATSSLLIDGSGWFAK